MKNDLKMRPILVLTATSLTIPDVERTDIVVNIFRMHPPSPRYVSPLPRRGLTGLAVKFSILQIRAERPSSRRRHPHLQTIQPLRNFAIRLFAKRRSILQRSPGTF
eukprot:6112748-Amphidinium_carterae.1